MWNEKAVATKYFKSFNLGSTPALRQTYVSCSASLIFGLQLCLYFYQSVRIFCLFYKLLWKKIFSHHKNITPHCSNIKLHRKNIKPQSKNITPHRANIKCGCKNIIYRRENITFGYKKIVWGRSNIIFGWKNIKCGW